MRMNGRNRQGVLSIEEYLQKRKRIRGQNNVGKNGAYESESGMYEAMEVEGMLWQLSQG